MSKTPDPEKFYANLKKELERSADWPSVYLYKFIVPSAAEKIAKLKDIFNEKDADISTKTSSKNAYTSVSVRLKMDSPEKIIAKYKEVGQKIEGVISL